jgi:hypothetical protein
VFEFLTNLIHHLSPGWQAVAWIAVAFIILGLIVGIIELSKLLIEVAVEGFVLGSMWLLLGTLKFIRNVVTYPFRKASEAWYLYRMRREARKSAQREEQNESEQQSESKKEEHTLPPRVDLTINYSRAVEIFDLQGSEDFTLSDLKKRYRSVIRNVHPDRGGSNFFAKQANEALSVIKKQKGW